MNAFFKPSPHIEAIALIRGKPVVSSKVFYALPSEIRARLFTVSGVDSANVMEAVRDEVAGVPAGVTWDKAKKNIAAALEPYLGEIGAKIRAEIILRVNAYQAFATANHRSIMEDESASHCQYVHGNCKVPTPSHQALDGIILPKEDSFWLDHTGPWGHLGCVCTKIGVSPFVVEQERAKDEKREPDQKSVLEGPSLATLQEGQLDRAGRTYNISTVHDKYKWHPDYLVVSMQQMEARYEIEVWNRIKETAQGTIIDNTVNLWEWLGGD